MSITERQNEASAELATMGRGETRTVLGHPVERLSNGSFRVGQFVSPPVTRTGPAGAAVQATARVLVERS